MVIYELIKQEEDWYYYEYFPEAQKEYNPGLICLNLTTGNARIEHLAEKDWEHDVSAEQLNKMAETINQMLTENDEPVAMVTKAVRSVFYGDMVVKDVEKKAHKGQLPTKGTLIWY